MPFSRKRIQIELGKIPAPYQNSLVISLLYEPMRILTFLNAGLSVLSGSGWIPRIKRVYPKLTFSPGAVSFSFRETFGISNYKLCAISIVFNYGRPDNGSYFYFYTRVRFDQKQKIQKNWIMECESSKYPGRVIELKIFNSSIRIEGTQKNNEGSFQKDNAGNLFLNENNYQILTDLAAIKLQQQFLDR